MAVEVDQPAEVVVPVDRRLHVGRSEVGVERLLDRAADVPVAYAHADHGEVGMGREVGEVVDRERADLLLADHLSAEVAQDLVRSLPTGIVVGAHERERAGTRRPASRPTVVDGREARGARIGARAHPGRDVLEGGLQRRLRVGIAARIPGRAEVERLIGSPVPERVGARVVDRHRVTGGVWQASVVGADGGAVGRDRKRGACRYRPSSRRPTSGCRGSSG